MLNIVLLCAGGASTGMLAKKIKEEAEQVGFRCEVSAYGVAEAATVAKDADVVLLGPQVGYQLEDVKKTLPGKVVMTIDMMDYGRMNGRKILKQAIKAAKELR